MNSYPNSMRYYWLSFIIDIMNMLKMTFEMSGFDDSTTKVIFAHLRKKYKLKEDHRHLNTLCDNCSDIFTHFDEIHMSEKTF